MKGDEEVSGEIGGMVKELRDLRAELKSFTIDREQHYQDHQFLKELREWVGNIKSTSVRAVVTAMVVALIGLVVAGFIVWSKKNIGN